MLFSPKMLANIVREYNGPSPRGVSCRFIKVNDQWGIKVYKHIETRDHAYKWQSAMHKVGLAPAVGIKFDVGYRDYCYLTQVAQPLLDGYLNESDRCNEWDKEFDRISFQPGVRDKIRAAQQKLRKYKCGVYDTHVANFGYLHGELVCIDFGDAGQL